MPPRLLAAHVVSPTEVALTFDTPVFAADGLAATLVPVSTPAVPAAAEAWSIEGASATITVRPDLSRGARYAVVVAGLSDANDELVSPPYDRVDIAPMARLSRRSFDLW